MTNKQSFILVIVAFTLLGTIFFIFLLTNLLNMNWGVTKVTTNNLKSVTPIVVTSKNDPLITSALDVYKSFVRTDDPVKGLNSAPLTILEFGDFECPYCAQIYKNLNQIIATYPGQVRLVWKDFIMPVHLNGKQAALAARCAADQGKFWEYHDYLFENQNALSRKLYNEIALKLNLDLVTFNSCLDSKNKLKQIGQGLEDGQRLGVSATPYLFIGNTKIDFALTDEDLNNVVLHELKNR